MRLVTYQTDDTPRSGFLHNRWIIDLQTAHKAWSQHQEPSFKTSIRDESMLSNWLNLLQAGDKAWFEIGTVHKYVTTRDHSALLPPGAMHPFEEVQLLPPIRRPGKLICVGLNYPPPPGLGDPAAPPYPILFHKVATALTGHRQPIVIPRISKQVEYEGELAVVIAKTGKNIPREGALDWVAGYSIANDIGAMDIQKRSSQWTSGKIFDTFCPLGPSLVSQDEIPNADDLRLRTQLNGETVQDGVTADMIFPVAHLVSYISTLTTLEPGDLILTGSPKYTGDRPDPRMPLKPGDTIQVEIEGLGVLTNPVIAEGA